MNKRLLEFSMNKPRLNDVFVLAKDINPVIQKGMSGVILEIFNQNSYLVEFVKSNGANYEYNGQTTFFIDYSFLDRIIDSNTKYCVDVIESYKLSDGKIIAFLKSKDGKIPDQSILEDSFGSQWKIKQYLRVTGSIATYEKIDKEEAQNIFQYLLEAVNQNDKPIEGTKLEIIRNV